jgi:hypothetical protein
MDQNDLLKDVIKRFIGVAVSKAPGGSGLVIRFVLDNLIYPELFDGWLFPKAKADQFQQYEKQVALMVEKQVEATVGLAAFNRVQARLQGLGDAFKDFAQVVDLEERKIRLGYLLTLADATVAEAEAVPDRFLYLLTDMLQVVAVLNIAVLVDQVQMYPDRYEHQLTLNKTAIRYSDLAGRLRDRFLWYRLGQIAEGKGIVEETEIDKRNRPGVGAEKRIRFFAYDDFASWSLDPYGIRTQILFSGDYDSGWVWAMGDSTEYRAARQKAHQGIEIYAQREKQQLYDWWDQHLTGTTAQFMQFVDWPGEKGERKARDRMLVQAYPLQHSAGISEKLPLLERIDLFLGQQMDQFALSGPRYVQTYRLPGAVKFGEQGNMFHRADSYDTAVAAIYLTLRGDLRRATDLADGLCAAIEHDPLGGGRIMAATKATGVIDGDNRFATSMFHPDGATRDIGNMCWAGIALTRLYAKTRNSRYLYNSLLIGDWILRHCNVEDAWQGYSGGEDQWGNKRLWRSVEHNVDAYALFLNLHALSGEQAWQDAANRAKTLVMACRTPDGYYVTGTGTDQTLNPAVVPTDTQSWTALAGIDPGSNARSLQYMLDQTSTDSAGYVGFKFAVAGSGVQNEITAGAAMALYLEGGPLRDRAAVYYDSLARQQAGAANGDGLGLVATPGQEADTGEGLGWKYFNWLHVASSAWTGLAFLARDNPDANPYRTVQMPA